MELNPKLSVHGKNTAPRWLCNQIKETLNPGYLHNGSWTLELENDRNLRFCTHHVCIKRFPITYPKFCTWNSEAIYKNCTCLSSYLLIKLKTKKEKLGEA